MKKDIFLTALFGIINLIMGAMFIKLGILDKIGLDATLYKYVDYTPEFLFSLIFIFNGVTHSYAALTLIVKEK